MVTLADIQKNEDIKALISAGNRYLAAMGFTEHGPRHVSYVSPELFAARGGAGGDCRVGA